MAILGLVIASAAGTAAAQNSGLPAGIVGTTPRTVGEGVLDLLAYSVVPDGTVSTLQINRHGEGDNDIGVSLGQLGAGFTWSDSFPLYLEGFLGYARYDPRFVFSDGQQQRQSAADKSRHAGFIEQTLEITTPPPRHGQYLAALAIADLEPAGRRHSVDFQPAVAGQLKRPRGVRPGEVRNRRSEPVAGQPPQPSVGTLQLATGQTPDRPRIDRRIPQVFPPGPMVAVGQLRQ